MSDTSEKPAPPNIPTLAELATRWQTTGFLRRFRHSKGAGDAYLRCAAELGWILAHVARDQAWPLEPPKPKPAPPPPPPKAPAEPNPFAVPVPGKSGSRFFVSHAGDALAPRSSYRPRRPAQ